MESEGNQQPVIEQDNFILKVKLLSNQVFQFNTRHNIPIPDLKKLIQAKTNVPFTKQRLIFGGNQMLDTAKLSDYVKESGLTIHLIAKMQPAPASQPTQQQTNIQQPSNPPQSSRTQPPNQQASQQGAQIPPPQQLPIPPILPGFPNLGNIFSSFMGGNPEPNQNSNGMNQLLTNLGNLGSFEIRMVSTPVVGSPPLQQVQTNQQPNSNVVPPHPPITQTNNNQNITQPSNPQQQQNQAQNQANQRTYPPPQMGALNHLHNLISRITIPQQPHVPQHLNQRQEAAFYLRRLHNQLLRFIPQLNRGIQLLNDGRVTHLQDFLPAFHMINRSNAEAIDIIQRLLGSQNQQQQQHQHQHGSQNTHQHQHQHSHPHHQHPHSHSHSHSPQNRNTQSQPPTAQRQGSGGSRPNQNQNRAQNNPPNLQQQINNPFDMLSGLIGPNSGFNFANIFGQRSQENNIPQQTSQQAQQERQPRQIPQQQAVNHSPPTKTQLRSQSEMIEQQNQRRDPPSQNFDHSSNARELPQVQNLNAASIAQQLNSINIPVQGQSGQPARGVNVMSLFGEMQQNGGIGQLLNMSLGDMADQGEVDPIYKNIFQVVSGGQIIAIFTAKNFSFLTTKKVQLRQAVLKSIQSAGSREQLISRYTSDLSTIFVPSTEIKNKEVCIKRVNKILRKYIEKVINIILDSPAELNTQTPILAELKLLFCETVQELFKFCGNTQVVFSHIRINTIAKIDTLAQGMAPLFYSIVERDLVRIYREYSEEQQRKRQRSEQEAKDEADLLNQIEEQSHKDLEYLVSYEHSKYYPIRK